MNVRLKTILVSLLPNILSSSYHPITQSFCRKYLKLPKLHVSQLFIAASKYLGVNTYFDSWFCSLLSACTSVYCLRPVTRQRTTQGGGGGSAHFMVVRK